MSQASRRTWELGKPVRLTGGFSTHEHPVVSPDGNYIAFYFGQYGSIQIALIDLRGRLLRVVSPLEGNSTQPAWSPCGTWLAYRHQATIAAKWEIWLSPFKEGEPPRPLLADPQWHFKHPSYHPTGKRLAYFSDEGSPGIFHLWEVELEAMQKRQLTHGTARNHCHPVYSPDGTRIVFHAYEGTDENKTPAVTNLFELDLASNELRQLTDGADQYKHPFYLDHQLITLHYEDNATGRRSICLMDLASKQLTPLTSGATNDKHPFPYRDRKGRCWVVFASKKLGNLASGELADYDLFLARLKQTKGKPVKPGEPRMKKSAGAKQRKTEPSSKQAKPQTGKSAKYKAVGAICKDCPYPKAKSGEITNWSQTKAAKVRGEKQACKKCPARGILDKPA